MAKTVLVCEDDDLNVKLFADVLSSAGYHPLAARTGQEAIEMALAQRPDLITLDFRPPLLPGEAVVRRLKTDPALRDIPVVAVTACAMVGDRERILAAGCDGYIAKPVSINAYLDTIAGFLAEAIRRTG